MFYGVVVYADDILLLSASRSGLQEMVNICHRAATERNLSFGTHEDPQKSKTKCIVFTKKRIASNELKCISLNGNKLPWVQNVKHFGHNLQANNSMKIGPEFTNAF